MLALNHILLYSFKAGTTGGRNYTRLGNNHFKWNLSWGRVRDRLGNPLVIWLMCYLLYYILAFPLMSGLCWCQCPSIGSPLPTTPKWTYGISVHYKHLWLSSSGFCSLMFSSWILCFPSCQKKIALFRMPNADGTLGFFCSVSAWAQRVAFFLPYFLPSFSSLPPFHTYVLHTERI